jgi:Prokaryotic homologs of the JAB domain
VGEWHSHPTNNNSPSVTDLTSLARVSQQPNYLTTQPVMVIMSRAGEPACTVHPANGASYEVILIEQPQADTP